jgi:hypothetical protein
MQSDLSMLEELNIIENLKEPHLSYVIGTVVERKRVAYLVLQKDEKDILLIDSSGFLIDSVFAGLSEKNAEHLAKKGPRKYKESLIRILRDQEMMQGVFEIVKALDEDLGSNIAQNQDRIKNIIQYIKDNRVAFEF